MSKPLISILTGAGISAESGLKTFRDSDGLWEGYSVYDVATPEAWWRNPQVVQKFYNERRKDIRAAKPNQGHLGILALEEKYNVHIITQNIDDLHERAGSKNVLHLHVVIAKPRSSTDSKLLYDIDGDEIRMGDLCENGSQLRPHVVWFGEEVPAMEEAIDIVKSADIFVIIGTSLAVYPAAGLVSFVRKGAPVYLVDPKAMEIGTDLKINRISEPASSGVLKLVEEINRDVHLFL